MKIGIAEKSLLAALASCFVQDGDVKAKLNAQKAVQAAFAIQSNFESVLKLIQEFQSDDSENDFAAYLIKHAKVQCGVPMQTMLGYPSDSAEAVLNRMAAGDMTAGIMLL